MVIFQHPYHPALNITLTDIFIVPIIILVVFFFSKIWQNKKIVTEPYYANYSNALIFKLIVSVFFALTVLFFYPGDSMAYFGNVNCFTKLLLKDSSQYSDILLYGPKPEFFSYFTYETGYPAGYMWRDPNAIFVARIYAPFMLLTYNSYFLSTLIAGFIGFTGIWRLYTLFCKLYPNIQKELSYSILFFPSLVFWSAGIMKDTLTMSAIGWIMYSFYNFAILRKLKIKYIIAIVVGSFIIINIKAYIFAALLPGLFIWFFFNQLAAIKSSFLKFVVAPILIIGVIIGFSFVMSRVASSMGRYGDIDKSIEHAQVMQQDLKRSEQYGENYYDIGNFESTPTGVLQKAPIAIVSGIFRPFIWEARNPFIVLAALESTFFMLFLMFVLLKTGLVKFFRIIISDPLLIFSFSFVLIFGFGIGLATANFGALVRYKIPMLPFFIGGLFIMLSKISKQTSNKK